MRSGKEEGRLSIPASDGGRASDRLSSPSCRWITRNAGAAPLSDRPDQRPWRPTCCHMVNRTLSNNNGGPARKVGSPVSENPSFPTSSWSLQVKGPRSKTETSLGEAGQGRLLLFLKVSFILSCALFHSHLSDQYQGSIETVSLSAPNLKPPLLSTPQGPASWTPWKHSLVGRLSWDSGVQILELGDGGQSCPC